MDDEIGIEQRGNVAVLEIRRGPTNYFDRTLLKALADAAHELAGRGCRAIVLGSEGRHFCAGADFANTPQGEARERSSRLLYREAARLFDIPIPVIAAVQGSAVGGGLGLACAADFRVAGPGSRFHANFARLGFHQGFGLSATLPRVVGHQRTLDLLYSGRRVDGQLAATIGLVDRLVADGTERAAALAWAEELAGSAPLAVRSMKQTLRAGLAAEVRQVLDRELQEQSWLWETEDSRTGIAASLARQQPEFSGR